VVQLTIILIWVDHPGEYGPSDFLQVCQHFLLVSRLKLIDNELIVCKQKKR